MVWVVWGFCSRAKCASCKSRHLSESNFFALSVFVRRLAARKISVSGMLLGQTSSQRRHSTQSVNRSSCIVASLPSKDSAYKRCGDSFAGHTGKQSPQRMQGAVCRLGCRQAPKSKALLPPQTTACGGKYTSADKPPTRQAVGGAPQKDATSLRPAPKGTHRLSEESPRRTVIILPKSGALVFKTIIHC